MANFDIYFFWQIFGLSGKNAFLDFAGIFFATYALYVFLLGVFLWAIAVSRGAKRNRLQLFLFGLGTALFTRFVVVESIRWLMPQPRPFDYFTLTPLIAEPLLHSPSFPSGHAAFMFAFVTLLFFYMRKAGWLYLLAIVISLSRIFVGVHWPSDVLGGAALGILIASFVDLLWLKKLKLPGVGV